MWLLETWRIAIRVFPQYTKLTLLALLYDKLVIVKNWINVNADLDLLWCIWLELKWLITVTNLFSNLSSTKMSTLPTLCITGNSIVFQMWWQWFNYGDDDSTTRWYPTSWRISAKTWGFHPNQQDSFIAIFSGQEWLSVQEVQYHKSSGVCASSLQGCKGTGFTGICCACA